MYRHKIPRRQLKPGWRLTFLFSGVFLPICLLMFFFAKPQPEQLQANQLLNNNNYSSAQNNVKNDDWRLLLVNQTQPLPDNYTINVRQLPNGKEVDERCYDDLQAMLAACRAEGLEPLVCSAYRSWNYQQNLFQNKINEYVGQGYGTEQAETLAAQVVAIPGTSEHQLGLAVDIVDLANQNLDETQEQTDVQQWLMAHSWEYGFIMRYPLNKSEFMNLGIIVM